MTYWERYENLCSSIGKKPSPAGKEIGVSSTTITKWKNGAVPSGDVLIKVADYFNVSTDYLLDRTDDPTPALTRRKKNIKEHRYIPSVWLVKERIQRLCAQQCKSISEITPEISMAMEDLDQWDESKGVSSISFERIADYLGCSVDYILGYTDDPTERVVKSGDIIGDNNSGNTGDVTVGTSQKAYDSFTEKFIHVFESLDFEKQVSVVNYALQQAGKSA